MRIGRMLENTIFPSFVASAAFEDADLSGIMREVYMMVDTEDNVASTKSNVGDSYHSPVYYGSGKSEFPLLAELESATRYYAQHYVQNSKVCSNRSIEFTEWWVSINSKNAYNEIHHHGRADLISLFYLKLPKDAANFIIKRNDGAVYSQLFHESFTINPEVGRSYLIPGHLWHFVEESMSDEERVCVSYNLYFNRDRRRYSQ